MARILVIDDDPWIRRMIRQILERAGHEVVTAPDGQEGRRVFRENPADLVVTDMVMPEMGGVETIAGLKDEYPNAKIIAISGGGRTGPYGYLKLAERFGAERVFPKPIRKAQLIEAVNELLGE
jgi:CheY-like chemotaxis protein